MTARRFADRVLALASFVAVLVPAVPAAADIISDEESVCRDKAAGDVCSLEGENGSCAKSTCTRNDYSDGPPPKSKQVECMVCALGKAPALANTDPKAVATDPKAAASEPTPAASTTKAGCANARIADPSLAVGSCVLGIALFGLALRGRRRA